MMALIWLIGILLTILPLCNANGYLQPEREARFASGGDSDSNVIYSNGSLFEALRTLESDSSLVLNSGQYQLEQYIFVSDLNNVRISGQGDVIISCNKTVGLAFINMTGLIIEGVRIEECGLSGTNLDHALSEIRQFIDLFAVIYLDMRIALLLGHCEDLQLNTIELYNNDGFGLVGINIIGNSVISELTAFNNTQPIPDCSLNTTGTISTLSDPDRYGGGAVFLYHEYLQEYQELYNDQSYKLSIENGNFSQNAECSLNYFTYVLFEQPEYIRSLGYRIGGGAGLTLMMAQLNYGMQIVTQNSKFVQNRAIIGSGAHLALFSGTKNTAIEFIDCEFSENGVTRELIPEFLSVGGAGLGIFTDFERPKNEQFQPPHVVHNLNTSILVKNSLFLRNTSPYGAGIYFYSAYKSAVSDVTDVIYFYIQNSSFIKNAAYTGSAMQLFELKYHAGQVGTQVQISDTNVSSNFIVSANSNGVQSMQQNTGIIDIRYMNMTLKGKCSIDTNSGTGLRAESSHVGIDGNVTFSENIGVRGGGMFLITYTYLIVLPNASLYFLNNIAREAGGAIYSNFLGLNSVLFGGNVDCFLYFNFNNIGPCVNCSELNKTGSFIKFEGNSAPAGGQVFGSAFQTCYWAYDLLISLNKSIIDTPVLNLLVEEFPTVFSFDTPISGPQNFKTQAQSLEAVGTNNSKFNVLPGERFNITFTARDNFNQIVSNVISAFVEAEFLQPLPNGTSTIGQNNLGLLTDNVPTKLSMSVSGEQNNNLSVVVYSNDLAGLARTEITVNLGECGLGFIFNSDTQTCVCLPELEIVDVICDDNSLQLTKTREDLWVGPLNDDGLLGVVTCPLLYCGINTNTIIPIEQGRPIFNAQCDPRLFRTGVACGDCQEGRSLVLATTRCLKCTNKSILLFPVFLILGIILIVFIYYIDISIAVGLLNGAIFFSNLITLYAGFLFPATFGGAGFISIISFLSLNFGIEACLYSGMGAIDRLLWQVSFPIYLFALMFLIIVLARTRVLSRIQNHAGLSAVRVFSTLLILCYVSFLQVASQLFGFVNIRTIEDEITFRWTLQPSLEYFSGANVLLIIAAIFLIVIYLVPFPMLLLFPSLVFRSKYLSKLKPLYDSFWHPFEPKYRWWLGFRLIFRWIPFLFTFLVPVPTNLLVTDLMLLLLLFVQLALKPFKSYWINFLDSLFICMLVIIFTGTLFFVANERKRGSIEVVSQGATIFNEIFTVMAFFIILGIFTYHFIIRFPKVKVFALNMLYYLSCKRSKFTPPQKSNENINNVAAVAKSDKKETQPLNTKSTTYSVVSTELREPLLEDDDCAVTITPSDRHTS